MTFYNFLHACFAWLFRLLYRIDTVNADILPRDGAYIVSANHTSAMDCVVLSAVSKRQIHYMAKAELFRVPFISAFLRSMGAFPVKRNESDVAAVKKSISVVESGEPLCVFPQGTRCPGVTVRSTSEKVKSGVGFIACKTGVDIIPVYIKTKRKKLKLFGKTTVIFGDRLTSGEYDTCEGRERYASAAHAVFEKICLLADEYDK